MSHDSIAIHFNMFRIVASARRHERGQAIAAAESRRSDWRKANYNPPTNLLSRTSLPSHQTMSQSPDM